MRIWLLSSGSSGNAAIVQAGPDIEGGAGDGARTGTGRLLIDAGLGPRALASRMRALGTDLFPRGVDGIVITHQHGDHIAHLEPLARALRAPIFLHEGISAPRVRARFDVRSYVAGKSFTVGAFEVASMPVPHDAPQVALRIGIAGTGARGLRFGWVTDLGHVPEGLDRFLGASDEVLLEANYCPDMMRDGPYPPHLKRRVTGPLGHLANADAGLLAHALSRTRVRRLWLGHLSRVNNDPARALSVVRGFAPGLEVEVLPHGEPRVLDVRPGKQSGFGEQMGLPFGPR